MGDVLFICKMKRNITLNIRGNEYQLTIPKIGQIRQIENRKVAMTPYYKELVSSNTILSNWTLDLIDMSAYFGVLCPQLLKDLKAPLEELDLFDFKQLREEYVTQVLPWINDFVAAMQTKTSIDGEETANSAPNT